MAMEGRSADTSTRSLKTARQLVLVISATLESKTAALYYYERNASDYWVKLSGVIPVRLGAHGMAWAKDLSGEFDKKLPRKKEGDLKTPAGVFAIGDAFAFDSIPGKMKTLQLQRSTICIDDTASVSYNKLVDSTAVPLDWKTGEHMRQVEQYRYGLVIEQNTSPMLRGRGSCIFVHIWKGPGKSTAGCTAMAEKDLLDLLGKLDQHKLPVIVQLPADTYRLYRKRLGLPLL